MSSNYRGSLKGVILDWAGTTVDYGCFAPTLVFVKLFEERGVPVTLEEARGPMGISKRDHIRAVIELPSVLKRWQTVHGSMPTYADIDSIYQAFVPRQIEIITQYAVPILGVVETVATFRQRGLKIGSTTGYTRAMMEPLLAETSRRGYQPDHLVCPDDVGGGRPAPWMCFENAHAMEVYPMSALVKIGDTLVDIEEGLNAGMWTIGLAKTGNELGLTEIQANALNPAVLGAKLDRIYTRFEAVGAHYVVDSLADVLPILDQIEDRLKHGDKP